MRKHPYSVDFSYAGFEFELVAWERDGSDLSVFVGLGRVCKADFIEIKEDDILTHVWLKMLEHFQDVMRYRPDPEEAA